MLVPFVKVVFEGPSKEYYTRLRTIAASGMTGCTRLIFSDFEGTIFYHDGRTVTALQESGMWMALGSEMVAPLENKAVAATGTMAIYELAPEVLRLFEGRKISTVVETDLGALVNVGMLIENLSNSASTCILKVRGTAWTGYVFTISGRIIGSSYVSDKDRHYGDKAINSIKNATGKAAAAIYFLEGGAPVLEAAPPKQEKPVAREAETPKAPEAAKPAAPAQPAETLKPAEAKPAVVPPAPVPAVKPAPEKEVKPVTAAPAKPVPTTPGQVELKVTTSDRANLKHESRMATLEALETKKIAWVNASVLKALQAKESDVVSLLLPGGKTEKVAVATADVAPDAVILPKKLRRRLSLEPGSKISFKP